MLHDVADRDAAFTLAHKVDGDALLAGVVRLGQGLQSLLEFPIQVGIEEAQFLHILHGHAADAVRREQIEQFHLDHVVLHLPFLLLDADDGALERAARLVRGRRQGDLNLFAAGLLEDVGEAGSSGSNPGRRT